MVYEYVTTSKNAEGRVWELGVVFKVLRVSQGAVRFCHGCCGSFAVSDATSKGLSHAIALSSVGKTTPISINSCITVTSGNCVQLLRKVPPLWTGASAGKACTINCWLVADGAITCTYHMRFSQIPRTEDCCLTLGVSYHEGGVTVAVLGGGGLGIYQAILLGLSWQ